MITQRLDALKNRADATERAAEILKEGGIVAVPTETVYGLAASALNGEAIKKVFDAKGRPQDNPLIVHISDIESLKGVATDIPDIAFTLAEHFWPGPFTMVLKRADGIDSSVSAGLDTVAVRMPSDPVICEIIRKSMPLAAPSANLSGSPSPTSAQHVLFDLDGRIDAVVMAGECEVGVESTVLSLVGAPRLLRPGAVTVEQLKVFLPDLVVDKAVLESPEDNTKVSSPGMKYKHYAPETETYLVEAQSEAFVEFVNSKSDAAAICFEDESEKITVKKLCYGSGEDEATLAKNMFSVLRRADDLGVSAVYVHAPSKSGVGLAVYNRLVRAAGFKVVKL